MSPPGWVGARGAQCARVWLSPFSSSGVCAGTRGAVICVRASHCVSLCLC